VPELKALPAVGEQHAVLPLGCSKPSSNDSMARAIVLSKTAGRIVMSETTWEATRNVVKSRAVREITVKGREQPVMTYEVQGLADTSGWQPDYWIVEFVTLIGVSSCAEICGYFGYHEPPMLFVITLRSMLMIPVWLLLTKKMALP